MHGGESGEEARRVGSGDVLPSYLAAERSGLSKSLGSKNHPRLLRKGDW